MKCFYKFESVQLLIEFLLYKIIISPIENLGRLTSIMNKRYFSEQINIFVLKFKLCKQILNTKWYIYKKFILLLFFMLCMFPQIAFSQLAKGNGKFVGNVIHDGNSIHSDFSKYWDQVTPENAGKWGSVEYSQGSYNWTQLDHIYNYAISHGFPFKEHNLIWGQQQPSFMSTLDSAQQYQEIVNWIDSCGHRYPKAAFCDVVNEPIHTPPSYKNALGGNGTTGWDWVINAFKLARKYWSPNTKLLLNEYNILNSNSNTEEYLKIIRLLQARGLIDGIGVQGHYFSVEGTSLSLMKRNLDSLATTGLPIYVSEFDINEQSDATQLKEYQSIFPLLYEYPDVRGITLWGYTEYETWKPYTYLVTDRLAERPALQWLRTYLANYLKPILISPVDTTGVELNATLTWHPAAGATMYRVFVSTDSTLSTVIIDATVTDTLLTLSPLDAYTKYFWSVKAMSAIDSGKYSGTASFTTGNTILAVRNTEEVPNKFLLSQNYPNPFNPSTVIKYSIPGTGLVKLNVFNLLGRKVATLVNSEQSAGTHEVRFDAAGLSSGIYFYRLEEGNFSMVKKMILLK